MGGIHAVAAHAQVYLGIRKTPEKSCEPSISVADSCNGSYLVTPDDGATVDDCPWRVRPLRLSARNLVVTNCGFPSLLAGTNK